MNFVLAENEKWINGYEGMYSVDSGGEVYSYRRKSKKAMAGAVIYSNIRKSTTYRIVTLFKNGGQSSFYYHRLVAAAFIPNPEGKPCVNHLNGIKTDNQVSNLEWVTRSENDIHAFKSNLRKVNFTWKGRLNSENPKSKPMQAKKNQPLY